MSSVTWATEMSSSQRIYLLTEDTMFENEAMLTGKRFTIPENKLLFHLVGDEKPLSYVNLWLSKFSVNEGRRLNKSGS